jgi:xanthine/uracil/vitamin C permease (AzgA family)
MADNDDRLREEEELAAHTSRSAARLFDVRNVIGGLFTVYGVIITIVGLLDKHAQIEKAQGVRINLWLGLAMLVLGLLFLLWRWLSPPQSPADQDRGATR